MLSKKQISNISTASLGIALLATMIAPPAASTAFVFASTAVISAAALSIVTAISNMMLNNLFTNQSPSTDNDVHSGGFFRRVARRPVHVVHHTPAPHVVHHTPAPHVVHHHTQLPSTIHKKTVPASVRAAKDNIVIERHHATKHRTPQTSCANVHILNPKKTATGTPIPEKATNVERVITKKNNASRQRKQPVKASQQPVVTSLSTEIPRNAKNIQRVITPKDSARDSHKNASSTNPRTQSSIGDKVILADKRRFTPQANRTVVQNAHTTEVQTGNRLSGNAIIRKR